MIEIGACLLLDPVAPDVDDALAAARDGAAGELLAHQHRHGLLYGRVRAVAHIGEIQSLQRDWSKSIEEDDPNIWTFQLVGTLGKGELIVKEKPGLNLDDDEAIRIEWAKLRLDSGEEFDVLP